MTGFEVAENEIEEIAKEIAKVHGISLETAAWTISCAMKIFTDIKEAFMAIGRLLSYVVGKKWEEFKEYTDRLVSEQFICNRQVWPTVWDMRKCSQVISNKPKFMVRKIIR